MSETLDRLHVRWTMRSPDGLEVDTVKLPNHLDCGVCGAPAALEGASGRIVCEQCRAHVVTVLVRTLMTSPRGTTG